MSSELGGQFPVAVCQFHLRPNGDICMPFASEFFLQLAQVSATQLKQSASPVFERVFKDDRAALMAALEQSAATLTGLDRTFRIISPVGELRWIRCMALPSRAGGSGVVCDCVWLDTPSRRQTSYEIRDSAAQAQDRIERESERLDASETRLRAILDTVVDVIVTIDSQGTIESVNNSVAALFGYEPHELVGRNVSILMPAGDAAQHDNYIRRYIKTGQAKILNIGRHVVGKRKDGSELPLYLAVSEMRIGGERKFTGVLNDVTEQVRAKEALVKSEARFRLSQKFSGIGTWDLDIVTGDLFWSDQIPPLFGYQNGERKIRIENFLSAVHPDDRETVLEAIRLCIDEECEYHVEHRVVWPDGTVRWLLEKGDTLRDESGTATHLIGIAQDITHRKCNEAELLAAKEEAERANKTKSRFLSNMSHELKTPLNAILGFTQLLEVDRKLDAQQRDTVNEIHLAGRHLLELINEILDLAKIESGRVNLILEATHVEKMLRECEALVAPMAARKNIVWIYDENVRFDVYVIADRMRLKQIVVNLLSNAVKYNRDAGTITISCEPVGKGKLRIRITDTGRGIPSELLDELFRPFSRLHAENSNIEGTGIGLMICKQLVELMHGSIGVQSEEGKGSTFWFELPMG